MRGQSKSYDAPGKAVAVFFFILPAPARFWRITILAIRPAIASFDSYTGRRINRALSEVWRRSWYWYVGRRARRCASR
jgi:hypothetical protein